MILMIDTNVILDILLHRKPFFEDSYLAILNADENADMMMISASAMTDIFYIVNKSVGRDTAVKALKDLQDLIGYCDVLNEDINEALDSDMKDIEDALVAAVAKRNKADYIITRNIADFNNSPVPAVTPAEFNILIGIST